MIGFSPIRCSSVAQTSTGVSGCWAASAATTVASFFEGLALLGRGRLRMARAGLLHRPADRLQGLPAALGQDRSEPEFARHPGRHFGARPQSAVRRWLTQTSLELVQQVRLQNRGAGTVPSAQVAQSLRTLGVVAGQQTLDPAPGIRHRGRDLGDVVALGQKPDRLKVPHRSHVRARAILLFER